MSPNEIHARLLEKFGTEGVLNFFQTDTTDPKNPFIYEPPQVLIRLQSIREVAYFCFSDPELDFDNLMSLASVDRGENLSVVYCLYSMNRTHKIVLRVDFPRENPSIPTVSDVWAAANWHEREANDMMGIVFEGHPDPRSLLLPEDWEGYPLRKDYKVQEFYRGMKVPY